MSAVFPSSKYRAFLKDSALFQLWADEGNQRQNSDARLVESACSREMGKILQKTSDPKTAYAPCSDYSCLLIRIF